MRQKAMFVVFLINLLACYEVLSMSELGNTGLDTAYQNAAGQELNTAPISFLPVCQPRQFRLSSQRQIRCACGLQCRFLLCRRVCIQKLCYRPLEYYVYDYRLMGGLCHRWSVCTYQAKCESSMGRRWIQYSPLDCQRINPFQQYQSGWSDRFA
ncbi:hypothetical protein EG68_02255 [Paragonimus skrjabini miyazakii]|uniref:Uncharacterized protein n=1 Tax=Paragonimus skrjabini miyazakii TaxID=59628 RepID=A0A8S9Z099_9TREM|nr:hypothetical protein EG68_02255 [Paragonimus skrjabini miyazakii]